MSDDVDPVEAEARAVTERIRAPEPAAPSGPSPTIVAVAMCKERGLDLNDSADLNDTAATGIRKALGMAPDAVVTNLELFTFEVTDHRAEQRWHELDQDRAEAEGWRKANFTTVWQLGKTDSEYRAWRDGQERYDPNFQAPPDPKFGFGGTLVEFDNEPSYDGAVMDMALREAAIAAKTNVRGVEITGSRVDTY